MPRQRREVVKRKKMQLQAEILSRAFLARRARFLDFRTRAAQILIAFLKESKHPPSFPCLWYPKLLFTNLQVPGHQSTVKPIIKNNTTSLDMKISILRMKRPANPYAYPGARNSSYESISDFTTSSSSSPPTLKNFPKIQRLLRRRGVTEPTSSKKQKPLVFKFS